MKKRIINGITALGLLLAAGTGRAQEMGGTAPDAKMLPNGGQAPSGMGGIYSPNLYAGTLNVNIPIYQYSTDGINLGVSLAYNTAGVKLDEISSNAGLHWNIVSEASISRQVKGYADEMNKVVDNVYLDGQYYTKVKGRLSCSFENSTQAADNSVLRDEESDEFTVSVGNLSFSFNIGKQRAILVRPRRNIKVELLYNGQPIADVIPVGNEIPDALALAFRITDEQGNRYYFEKGDWLEDRLSTQLEAGGWMYSTYYDYITRWVIKKVTLANGQEINYTYNSHLATTVLYHAALKRESTLTAIYDSDWSGSDVEVHGYVADIATISYPDGNQVQFNYETDAGKKRCDAPSYQALREIVVSGGSNCLRYRLNQSYYVAKAWSNTTISEIPYGSPCVDIHSNLGTSLPEEHMPSHQTHRLKLNSITLLSCDGSTEEPYYSFVYDNTALPPRFYGTQDFFGYYNNAPFPLENLLIPRHYMLSTPTTEYGADRTPDLGKMKAAVLTDVKNAYGGKVSFGYQLHSSLENVLPDLPSDPYFFSKGVGDGLCIESITESDSYHPGNNRVTSFLYDGGQIFLNGGYFHTPYIFSDATSSSIPVINFTGHFVSPHHLVNGANHGYSSVFITVKALLGGSYKNLSQRRLTFTNFKDATSNNQPRYQLTGAGSKHYYELPFTDKQYIRDWEMGLPLSIKEFDENGYTTMETVNTYEFLPDNTSALDAGVENTKIMYANYLGAPSIWTGPPDNRSWVSKRKLTDSYRPFSGKALLQSTAVRKYVADNSYIDDYTTYAYDSRQNLDYITTRNSKGAFIKTDQVYNYDLPGPGTAADMTAAGLEKLTGTERWLLGGSGAASDKLLDATINSYTFQGGLLQPLNLYQLSGGPLSYGTVTGYSGSGLLPPYPHSYMNAAYEGSHINYFRKISEVILRDANGNPLETYMPATSQYKAMIWDQHTNRKLAEAGSCRYEDIAYCSFEEAVPPSPVTFRGNLGYSTLGVQGYTVLGESAPTGSMVYRLHSGILPADLNTAMPLQQDKTYILSFWFTSTGSLTAMPHIEVAGTPYAFTSNDEIATRGSWKQYQVRLTPPATGPLTISAGGSTDILIDEVRLFPLGALMQSQYEEPLFGIRAATDASGRTTYYQYDQLGRQSVVRDQDGNILSRTRNVVQGAD